MLIKIFLIEKLLLNSFEEIIIKLIKGTNYPH